MRRFLTWVVVTIGIAALIRRLRRRGASDEAGAQSDEEDPADELRRKLAESRFEETVEEEAIPAPSVEERRAGIHEQGRATLDDMHADDRS